MKKILAIALALMMVLGVFAACDNSKSESDEAKKGSDATAPAANPTEANDDSTAPEEGDPADENKGTDPTDPTDPTDDPTEPAGFTTVNPGKLTMATNAYFRPYEYYEGDKIVGIDAEIAAAIAEKLGLELVIEDMDFNSIITAVKQGGADFGLAGMTVSEDRLKEVDFSISYATGVQVIIVKEGSAITSVDDLYAEGAAYKVGVQLGTTGDTYATDDFGADLVTQYTNGNEAVIALLGGDVDCVIIDNEPAKAFVAANAGLAILDTTYADEDYAACFAQDNDALRAAVDQAIMELTMDGTIDEIIDKYIK